MDNQNSNGELRYGCVVFDDPAAHTTGWKAVEEAPATRLSVNGTSILSTDTVWLTNMAYQLARETGLGANYRFLTSEYLREDIRKMADRHGNRYNPETKQCENPRELAEFGARILTRTLKVSKKLLDDDTDEEFLPRFSLKQGFRDMAGLGRDPVYTTEMDKFVQEAICYNTNCEREQYVVDDNIGYFRIPPREHCIKVMDINLPHGEFREIPKADLPPQKAAREEVQKWLSKVGVLPGLFKITCRSFEPQFNALINYGESASGFSSYKRQWVSSPEIAFLSAFSEITVHQAYVTQNLAKLNPALEIARSQYSQTDMSISMGVFYENLWTGMCCRSSLRPKAPSPDKTYVNTFTPFLRAMDRVTLFDKALQFTNAGFDVAGYATGMLRVSIKDQDPVKIYDTCLQTRMIPPFLGCNPKQLPPPSKEDPLSYTQWMYATSDYERLMAVDKKCVDLVLQQNSQT
jgi:hypothetical protein